MFCIKNQMIHGFVILSFISIDKYGIKQVDYLIVVFYGTFMEFISVIIRQINSVEHKNSPLRGIATGYNFI